MKCHAAGGLTLLVVIALFFIWLASSHRKLPPASAMALAFGSGTLLGILVELIWIH